MSTWQDEEDDSWEAQDDLPEEEQEVSTEPVLENVSSSARLVFGIILVLFFIGGALVAIEAIGAAFF